MDAYANLFICILYVILTHLMGIETTLFNLEKSYDWNL